MDVLDFCCLYCDSARLAAQSQGPVEKILLTSAPLLLSNIAEAANSLVSTGFPSRVLTDC